MQSRPENEFLANQMDAFPDLSYLMDPDMGYEGAEAG
jgi:hypothetical protein